MTNSAPDPQQIMPEQRDTSDLDLRQFKLPMLPPEIGTSRFPSALNLAGTGIRSVGPLEANTWLRRLNLWQCPMDDLTGLALCHGLEWLNLGLTHVSNISPLRHLTKLRHLDLTGTSVSDLTPLLGLRALEELILRDTACDTLETVMQIQSLRVLDVSGLYIDRSIERKIRPGLLILR